MKFSLRCLVVRPGVRVVTLRVLSRLSGKGGYRKGEYLEFDPSLFPPDIRSGDAIRLRFVFNGKGAGAYSFDQHERGALVCDAFRRGLEVGDRVLYAVNNSHGTVYVLGNVMSLDTSVPAFPKVSVWRTHHTRSGSPSGKPVSLFAQNVIKVGDDFVGS